LGISNRAVAATRMNASSSRSHAIFTIHVQQRRLVPSAAPSPAPSDEGTSPSSPLRGGPSQGAREADMVEELVEAHMVFVDLAGMLILASTVAILFSEQSVSTNTCHAMASCLLA